MNGVQLVLVVLGAIVVTAYARRRELLPPLVITVLACAASFIPGTPRLELEPDIILSVLVPPLIYSTALAFSFTSFVRLLVPILRLGVLLVIATAFAAGAVAAGVVPALTMSTAIVLGAAIAPLDAVSALAIGRELGLRRNVLTLLTGESLVNDAAALTLFTVAVASVTGAHSFIDGPILLFLYGAGVGTAVGVGLASPPSTSAGACATRGWRRCSGSSCRSRRTSGRAPRGVARHRGRGGGVRRGHAGRALRLSRRACRSVRCGTRSSSCSRRSSSPMSACSCGS